MRRGIDAGLASVIRAIHDAARPIETNEQIAATATISSGDSAIGDIVAEALNKVGAQGIITAEASDTFGLALDFQEGMRFDRGYLSPYFVTDFERLEVVLDNPYILLVSSVISSVKQLMPIVEKVMKHGRPLVIVAEDVTDDALATLVVNNVRDIFKSAAVKSPGFGDRRELMLRDIAIMTGGQVISEAIGVTLEAARLDLLGSARKVVITKHQTSIIGGAGDAAAIAGRVKDITTAIKQSTDDYDTDKLRSVSPGSAAGQPSSRSAPPPTSNSKSANIGSKMQSAMRGPRPKKESLPGAALRCCRHPPALSTHSISPVMKPPAPTCCAQLWTHR